MRKERKVIIGKFSHSGLFTNISHPETDNRHGRNKLKINGLGIRNSSAKTGDSSAKSLHIETGHHMHIQPARVTSG